jgi:hypothetical protein|tara:strand:+ start:333 stop:725 length:393 start_codon:yes stop_codon:yes gene_type:complete
MATTTANITISSADLTDNALNITNTATLNKRGNEEGLDTIISATKTFTSTSAVDLITVTGFTGTAANKVYIANTSTDTTTYFTIGIESEEVGRLYGGDWMFIPWDANTDDDITITPSVATAMTCEYIVFS